jgi:hypothetical protein
MSVGYILTNAGKKMGLDPSVENERATLLQYLNEAAPELYTQSDLVGSLMEQVFKVNGDQTLSLPAYVGELRAVREYYSMQTWHINQMRPRYNQFNWQDTWRNFRLLGKRALMATVTNLSKGVISVVEVETPPIVITLTGPIAGASCISESVTMDSVSKNTVNSFTDYVAVKKDRVNSFDVTLTDVDGKVLTVIPNNELEAKYQCVDISLCPWLPASVSTVDNYVEILYKKALNLLTLDSDEFPCLGYDNVLVNKIMQLWAEEQGKADVATMYDTKASRTAARIYADANKSTEDVIALVANPHDSIHERTGTALSRRRRLYTGSN